jgi:hypothetical protein
VASKDGREVGGTTTDTFGEFVIDGLEPNSGEYNLEFTAARGKLAAEFDIGDESCYMGVLTLKLK